MYQSWTAACEILCVNEIKSSKGQSALRILDAIISLFLYYTYFSVVAIIHLAIFIIIIIDTFGVIFLCFAPSSLRFSWTTSCFSKQLECFTLLYGCSKFPPDSPIMEWRSGILHCQRRYSQLHFPLRLQYCHIMIRPLLTHMRSETHVFSSYFFVADLVKYAKA